MKKRKTIYRGDLRQYVKLMNTIWGSSPKYKVTLMFSSQQQAEKVQENYPIIREEEIKL